MLTPTPLPRTAADVMTPRPLSCDATSPVLDAVRIFRGADCGAVPVFDQGKLVGVLTDRDVALALPDYGEALRSLPLGKITTPGVVTVSPADSLELVVAKLGDRAVRRLLVIDNQGDLVGIIGWSDVAPHVSERTVGHAFSQTLTKS